jgi:hypothetical protein
MRILLAAAAAGAAGLLAADAPPTVRLAETNRAFLKEHCVGCHGPEKQKGKLRLDDISFGLDSVENADRWQKVLNQVNSGEMPPDDAKQPPPAAKADFLEALSQTLVSARRTLGDAGGKTVVRRLNRREYQNTIRDLLGVEVDVHALPADGGTGTFDTVGSALYMSGDQVEQYLALGRRALDDAFARHEAAGRKLRLRVETEQVASAQLRKGVAVLTQKVRPYLEWTAAVDAVAHRPENAAKAAAIRAEEDVVRSPARFYRRWAELKDAPPPTAFGFKDAFEGQSLKEWYDQSSGDAARYHALPYADRGSYLFVFIVRPQESITVPKDWPAGEYVLRVRMAARADTPAGRHFIEAGHPTEPGAFDLISAHHVTGSLAQPQVIEIPVTLRSNGNRTFAIREKRLNSRENEVSIAVRYREKHGTWYPPAMWIDWMEIEARKSPEPAPELFSDRPAREIIETFARKAVRRTRPDPAMVDRVTALYERRKAAGLTHAESLKESLGALLASPSFLYLNEPSSADGPRRLTNEELATRLAYLLWSAPPDQELLATQDLGRPAVLAAQVDRMLTSPRSRQFVTSFTHQWLGLDRLDFFRFNPRLFPRFDDSAKMAVREEVFANFAHLLRTDGSLRRLLKTDEVIVNGLMADYYGITGVAGDAWQPVKISERSPRGGLLGMAAITAMGGNGERTSPVERGAWVLRKLLHDPPPPAPPNIPQLSRLGDKALSPRERVLAHQEEPQCRQCHRKIDPIGFGLENFDAAGQWRMTEFYAKALGGRKDWPIDASGALHKGPAFKDYFELRDRLAERHEDFARGFTEALIEYGLGRPYGFSDAELADAIFRQAKDKDFALRAFLHALVSSQQFLSK